MYIYSKPTMVLLEMCHEFNCFLYCENRNEKITLWHASQNVGRIFLFNFTVKKYLWKKQQISFLKTIQAKRKIVLKLINFMFFLLSISKTSALAMDGKPSGMESQQSS